jgi:hypothetical protein
MTTKYSMKGYSFKEWAVGNKETFKLIAAAVLGLSVLFTVNLTGAWATFAATMTSLVSKLAIDAIDYWLKEE